MEAIPRSRYLVFVLTVSLALVADLWSKTWMFANLGMPDPQGKKIWIVDGILSFETVLNEGALFGQGQGMGALFIGLSVVALAGIVYWLFVRKAARDLLLTLFLGGICAGILGNLYDRLGLPALKWHAPYRGHRIGDSVYAVRDFIHFQTPWFDWPVFNIADCLLVCGVAALAFHAYVLEPRREKLRAQLDKDAPKTSTAKNAAPKNPPPKNGGQRAAANS